MSISTTVKYVFLAFFFLMLSVTAHAVNGRTTYQAKIMKPDGYPLEATSVIFRFTVLDPTGSCVLFVEDYPPANMTGSGGLISFALGSGSRTYPASGTMTFAKVFDNAEPIFTCQTPAVYNPVPADNRKIVMQFNDGNGWQTLPAMAINAVPYAMYAGKSDDSKTLNNKSDTAFVEYSTLASLNCQSNEAIKFNGVSFGCIAISSATVVTSGTVITALGYTPADGASVTALSSSLTSTDSNLASVSSSVFSVSSTVSSLAGSVSSLQSSTAASFAAITSSQWNNVASGISYLSGNVGVGTSTPVVKLDVSGGVRISMESAACAVSYAGTLRYNAGNVEFCNGSTWSAFGVSGAGLQVLNGSTSGTQTFGNGTAGNSPAFVTANGVHTLNIPLASTATVTAGLISNSDYQNFNNKITSSAASISQVLGYTPASASALGNYLVRANNLSDLTSSATARINLGVGYIGTLAAVDLGSSDVSGTLAIARTPSYTGDVTKAAASDMLVLSNSGVTAGTYTKVTVDAKGRVISSSSLASSDVTTALGYTPAASGSFTSSQWNTSGTTINYMAGNVGIGTTNPQAKLEVNDGSNTSLQVIPSGGVAELRTINKAGGYYSARYDATQHIWSVAGTEKARVDPSGNVGIGTTSPQAKLHIEGGGQLIRGASGSSTSLELITNSNAVGTGLRLGQGYATATDSTVWIENLSNAPMIFRTNATARMTIDGSGNVGVGTTSPADALDVNGTLRFKSLNNPYYSEHSFLTGNHSGYLINRYDTAVFGDSSDNFILGMNYNRKANTFGTTANGSAEVRLATIAGGFSSAIMFNTAGSGGAIPIERMRVASNGNVGVGTSTPTAKLHLAAGTISNASLKMTSGTLLSTAEDGAIEYDGTNLYYTDSTNTRRALASTGGGSGQTFSGANTFTGQVNVSNNTASTNSSTGALVVSGGIGVGGALNVAGSVTSSSNIQGVSVTATSGMISPYIYGSTSAAGSLTLDSTTHATKGNIVLAPNGGNVGIGMTSPAYKLDVAATSRISGDLHIVNMLRAYGGNLDLKSATGDVVLSPNTSELMRLTASGNVGIGTTDPGTSKTKIYGTGAINNKLLEVVADGVGGGQTGPFYAGYFDSIPNNSATDGYGIYAKSAGNTGHRYGVYGQAEVGSSWIDSYGVYGKAIYNSAAVNGKGVGIYADATTTGTTLNAKTYGAYITNSTVYAAISYGAFINATAGPTTVIPLVVASNNVEKFRIDSNGNVGIGTSAPSQKLEVASGSVVFNANSDSGNYIYLGGPGSNSKISTGGSNDWIRLDSGFNIQLTSANINMNTPVAALNGQLSFKPGLAPDYITDDNLTDIYYGNDYTTPMTFSGRAKTATQFIFNRKVASSTGQLFSVLESGISRFAIDSSGNVGVGVTNPSAKLHLAAGTTTNTSLKIMSGTLLSTAQDGAIEYDGTNLYYTDSTNTRRALASTNGGSGQIFSGTNTFTGQVNVSNNTASTNSSTGALIVSGGAGIGGALNVAGAVSFGSTLNVTGQISGSSRVLATGYRANQGVPDSNDSSTNGYAFGADGDTGLFSPGSGAANGVLAFYSNNSEKMRITASGNVGIGTISPGAKLEVSGDIALGASATETAHHTGLQRLSNGTSILWYGGGSGSLQIKSGSTGPSGDRMTLASNGNVGIGTTSPGYKLTVPAGISVGDAVAGSSEGSLTPLIHSYLGTSGDVGAGSTIYILLAYNQSAGSGINTSGFDGEIYAYRGSAGSWNNATKYDVALKTAYNGPGLYRFNTSGPMAGAQIVTLTYGGTSYMALQAPASSAQDVYISGRFWGFKPIMLDSVNHAGLVTAVSTLSYPYMATSVGANGSAANIGIGTGNPNTKFVVYNGTTFNPASNVSAAVTLQGNYGGGLVFSDTKYIGLWSTNAGQTLNFATNSTGTGFGAAQMVIDNGNVGIGATVPARKLHLANSTNVELVMEQTDAKTDFKKWNFVVDAGNATTASNFYIRQLNDALGGGNVPFSINGTSGYVSIGNGLTFAAPVGDPAPTITTRTVPAGQGAANEKTELILFHSNDYANGSGADQITLRAPGLSFQTYENATVANINDNNGYNERMYIAPNGFVGIGTAAPTALLHVNGSILANAITGGQLNGAGNFHLDAWSSGADRSVYLNWSSGTGGAKIGNGSQNWGPISASAFNTSSDRRLKENIRPIPYALEKVLQLDAVTFTWKDQIRHKQEGERLGLIAQNVEKIFPQAVRVDHGENTLPGGTKLVTYPDLVAPLIAAIKELYHKWVDDSQQLHETVEQQAREIASVKEENKQLKAENAKTKRQNDEIKAYLCGKDPAAPICK